MLRLIEIHCVWWILGESRENLLVLLCCSLNEKASYSKRPLFALILFISTTYMYLGILSRSLHVAKCLSFFYFSGFHPLSLPDHLKVCNKFALYYARWILKSEHCEDFLKHAAFRSENSGGLFWIIVNFVELNFLSNSDYYPLVSLWNKQMKSYVDGEM